MTLQYSTQLAVGTARTRGYLRATRVSGGNIDLNVVNIELTAHSGVASLDFNTVGIDWGAVINLRLFV